MMWMITFCYFVIHVCLFVSRFAKVSEAAQTDWSSFTKGYFLNRDTLVAVLLLIDASVPPQKIDLDCANWLGRNNVFYLIISNFFTMPSLIYNYFIHYNLMLLHFSAFQIPITFVFTKCDKMKVSKGKRPDENIRNFQQLIQENYRKHPPWIMTSSVTGLGRDELLLHMSQLRNYWDQ